MRRFLHLATVLALVTTLAVALSTAPAHSAALTPPKPNILMIVADDQANSTFNRSLMPTVFSQIVDRGELFDRHYVASSLCCPSRSELLTGLFEQNTGVDSNELDMTRPTIVDALHQAGYRTAIAGKYLNSHACASPKPEFDLWVCQGNGGSSYSLVDPKLNVNGTWTNRTGVAPEILADYLTDFIGSTPADKPFFAMYTPTSPHMPANDPRYATLPVTPPRGPSWNEDTTAANKPNYTRIPPFDAGLTARLDNDFVSMTRAVRGLDDSVKTLLAGLGARANNTLVVYVSDNGYLYGEHRGHFKEVAYEEAVRTPMAIRYPAQMKASLVGTTSHALVQNIDFAPTFADEAGIQWNVDGTSLMPLVRGDAATVRSAAIIEHCEGPSYPCGVTRPLYWSLGAFAPPSFLGVVESRMKYVAYATGERELYDLSADPNELHNLAGNPTWAAEQARLDTELQQRTAPHTPNTTLLRATTGPNGSLVAVRTVGFTYFADTRTATFTCSLLRDAVVVSDGPCPAAGFAAGPLADGDYTFRVAAVAPNGTADPTPETRTFSIHRVGPSYGISGVPAASRQRSGTIRFRPAVATTNVECQLSATGVGAWKPCSPDTGYAYSNLRDGRWIFRVRGTGPGGVQTSPPSEAWFRVDNAGPTAAFTSAPARQTKQQTASFAFGFGEPVGAPVMCRIDTGAQSPCDSGTLTTGTLANGTHVLGVTAVDAVGNAATTNYQWVIDRTAPTISGTSPAGTMGPDPFVKVSANETVKWVFSVDGGPYFDGDPTFMILYSLADGPHVLRSRAYDAAGNLSPILTQTWTQSSSAPSGGAVRASGMPTTTITAGPSGTTTNEVSGFAFTADVKGATFECALDSTAFTPCSSPVVYEDQAIGDHTFAVRATANGTAGPAATRHWTITA
ncbi:MAG TPA: sulfatase-like hydrolase/transferase [Acidimicrobiales bacterium]|nr:sulfatase-like hydrolase/transferase [Acidimicrobiales bacterium]